jgi:hypothetical protein
LVFFLLGVALLWVCNNWGLLDDDSSAFGEEIQTKEKKVNLPSSYDNDTELEDENNFSIVKGAYVDYYKEPKDDGDSYCSPTHYNYTDVAAYITSGCENDYQRIRAIYRWVCENIEYDTSYSIHTADSCYDTKKGVCQAYSELFYRLAKAVGVKVEIISGKSKDYYGSVNSSGHAWLFAYTRENHGILLDPTWGAGYVDTGKSIFTRRENCWVWFNVNPEWMILSHFPDDESYQLIKNPMSYEEFLSLIPVSDLWVEYGLDVHKLYKKIRGRDIRMPIFYGRGEGKFEIIEMPLCDVLKIGKTYTFRIRKKTIRDFAIHNNKEFVKLEKWKAEGDSVYSIDYVVNESNNVTLSIQSGTGNVWHNLVEYQVK